MPCFGKLGNGFFCLKFINNICYFCFIYYFLLLKNDTGFVMPKKVKNQPILGKLYANSTYFK